MTEMLPLAEARSRFSELASRVETTHERIVVTRNGKPAFMLVAIDDMEGLEETLAILSDPQAMADIRQSERDIAGGDVTTMTKDQMIGWIRQGRAEDRSAG